MQFKPLLIAILCAASSNAGAAIKHDVTNFTNNTSTVQFCGHTIHLEKYYTSDSLQQKVQNIVDDYYSDCSQSTDISAVQTSILVTKKSNKSGETPTSFTDCTNQGCYGLGVSLIYDPIVKSTFNNYEGNTPGYSAEYTRYTCMPNVITSVAINALTYGSGVPDTSRQYLNTAIMQMALHDNSLKPYNACFSSNNASGSSGWQKSAAIVGTAAALTAGGAYLYSNEYHNN